MSYRASFDKKNTSRTIFRYSLENFNKDKPITSRTSNEMIKPHIKIKIDKSRDGIKNLIEKYSSLKTSNENLNSLSEIESKNLESKEHETNKLNEYLDEIILENDELKNLTELELHKRNLLETEQKSIAEYCNDLKTKFINYHETIQDYTDRINNLTQNNQNLQDDYDKEVEQLNIEIKKKQSHIEDRIKIIEIQQDQIIEKDNKILNILKEIEEEKNKFNEKRLINKIKFQEIEKKYAELQKKVYELEVNDDIRKVEMKGSTIKNSENNNKIGEIYMKINKYVNENKSLENNIKDLSIHLNDLLTKDSPKDMSRITKRSKSKQP